MAKKHFRLPIIYIRWYGLSSCKVLSTINEIKGTSVDTIRTSAMQIRQRRSRSCILYIHKTILSAFIRSALRALLEFIPAFPVRFPRSFLPSASVTPRNSNFRLPSLATVRILCVWGILFALHPRASHIWHVARGRKGHVFSTRLSSLVRLLQKFNQ